MSDLAIRPATSADLDAITEIYADAVTNGTASYELEPPTRAEMVKRFEGLVAGGFPYIVAEASNGVLGYAYAGPFRPRRAYRFMVEDSIYLAPEAQGRGIGRLLLAMLVNIFLQSSALQFAISAIGVLVFAGLTAYDTQQIKEMYYEGDGALVAGRKAIMGALRLYLDFINMFMFLLQFMGASRE